MQSQCCSKSNTMWLGIWTVFNFKVIMLWYVSFLSHLGKTFTQRIFQIGNFQIWQSCYVSQTIIAFGKVYNRSFFFFFSKTNLTKSKRRWMTYDISLENTLWTPIDFHHNSLWRCGLNVISLLLRQTKTKREGTKVQ